MSALTVEGLVAGYTSSDMILKGVSIRIEESEIVGIFGPNGAGKSTLLKAVAGLVKPREGKIRVAGDDIGGRSPTEIAKRGVVYVPQEANVFNSMTIEENLEIGAFLRPGNSSTMIANVLKRFPELHVKRKAKARSLSGGQRQVLAMAMALIIEPQIMLLDEPSVGLSPIASERLLETVREINQHGITVVLVEQNVRAALKVVNRGYILVDGKNAVEGLAQDLASNVDLQRKFLGH